MRLAPWFIVLCLLPQSYAQSGLNRPFLGQMIDRRHQLRPVYGAGGSFHAEAPVADRVLSSACSATFCLAKTESAILSSGGATPAPAGEAIFALDSTGATIYFSESSQFARWQNGALAPLNLTVDGKVLSLRSTASGLNVAVQRSGLNWIVASDGTILDALPSAATAVLLLPTAAVYATPDSLVLRRSDASELRFRAPGVASLTALGDGYVEAASGAILYVLRTIPGGEQLYQLPQAQPTRERER